MDGPDKLRKPDVEVQTADASDPVLIPLALITPAIAFIVTLPLLVFQAWLAAAVGLIAAVAIGAPVLSWARRLGLRGPVSTALVGAATGFVALYAPSGIIWELYRERLSTLDPIIVATAAAIGAATGAAYATIHDQVELAPAQVRWRILSFVVAAATVPWIAIILVR